MPSLKYKINDKIGDWIIKEIIDNNNKTYYKIICKCGYENTVKCNKLYKKTCCFNCAQKKHSDKYIGYKPHSLLVLDNPLIDGKRRLLVRCDCKKEYFILPHQINIQKSCKSCIFGHYIGKIINGCILLSKINSGKWEIKCHCGNIFQSQLRGKINCGCQTSQKYLEYSKKKIGNKFGYLTVIDVKKGKKHNILICKCKCKNVIEIISGHELRQNSCGCLKKENSPKNDKKGNARFSNDDILSMREMHNSNLYSIKELANIFSCDISYIYRIVKGLIWKNLTTGKKTRSKAGL